MLVALATAAFIPDLATEDQALAAVMKERGIRFDVVVWDSAADWSIYDVVIVRSIWDYHLKYAQYLAWLDLLERKNIRVLNDPSLQRWNASKTYLLELQTQGVSVVPTSLNPDTLSGVSNSMGWDGIVVKPVVGASGYETWTSSAPISAADEARYTQQRSERDMLVQQFIPGVRDGEKSYVFINGEYTHAVMKRAAPGEFRVHIEHGGSVFPYQPPSTEIEWACDVVRAAPSNDWLYARVDAVDNGKELLVMELEMLDPELFFTHNSGAAHGIANRILAMDKFS
jgi:glutathione synthase/RimK-type ligase-like ATP-grasp enzyme